MEATQNHPNLLSEKEAAKRLGVARITLLRAREAGRIKFFRIGTRVLYSEAHLIEFLDACERNGRRPNDARRSELTGVSAKRKDNRVSASRRSVSTREKRTVESGAESSETGQACFQFVATR